jgi:hypothetical protein
MLLTDKVLFSKKVFFFFFFFFYQGITVDNIEYNSLDDLRGDFFTVV